MAHMTRQTVITHFLRNTVLQIIVVFVASLIF